MGADWLWVSGGGVPSQQALAERVATVKRQVVRGNQNIRTAKSKKTRYLWIETF